MIFFIIYIYLFSSHIFTFVNYSRQTLVTKYNVPEDVLSTCLSLGNRGYLLSHIKSAQMEYSKAIDKDSWVTHKQMEIINQKCIIISILFDEFRSDYKPMTTIS